MRIVRFFYFPNESDAMSRANQKMIGIYVSADVHQSIKKAAQDRGMTVKEYLLSLHRKEAIDATPKLLEEIRQKTDQILAIVGRSSKRSLPSEPPETKQPPPSSTSSILSPKLLKYLEQFRSVPRQYNALKETLEIILRHGGKATSVQIKEARGFSRTTLIKGQVERLEKDGIIQVDHGRKPFVVELVESYRQ